MELLRSLGHYHDQLVVHGTSYHLAPEVFARNGAVAVAALILVPLAALAWGRRWSSFVLGGSLAVLAVMLVPFLFEHLSDAVSLSQSRRAPGFLPFAFALRRRHRRPERAARDLRAADRAPGRAVFQALWPGDFGFRLVNGGPSTRRGSRPAPGVLALVAALFVRRPLELDRDGWLPALAAGLFVLPVAVHGFARWTTSTMADRDALTPGLVDALREDVPKRGVVFSDLQTSYRIAAAAPVLIVAAPPEHVADTKQNRPYERRKDVMAFSPPGDLAIPRRYHARWLVIARVDAASERSRCGRYTRTRALSSTSSDA